MLVSLLPDKNNISVSSKIKRTVIEPVIVMLLF